MGLLADWHESYFPSFWNAFVIICNCIQLNTKKESTEVSHVGFIVYSFASLIVFYLFSNPILSLKMGLGYWFWWYSTSSFTWFLLLLILFNSVSPSLCLSFSVTFCKFEENRKHFLVCLKGKIYAVILEWMLYIFFDVLRFWVSVSLHI